MKMMTPPLACGSSGERMQDREEYDQIAVENIQESGKRKDELRLDSWTQIR